MRVPTPGTTRLTLWGPDHLDPEQIALAGSDPAFAVAMSRGRQKDGPTTDPNEDAVAVLVRGDRILLTVADGHYGRQASLGAVRHLVVDLDPPPWTLEAEAAYRLTEEAARAAQHAVEQGGNPRSRTTLTVALVSGRELWWTSTGDSALYVVDGSGARRLDRPSPSYLGGPVRPLDVRAGAEVGRETLEPGAWVCVVSDGFTDFARPSAPSALGAVLGEATVATVAARRLVEAALDGGAGDNVTVAVARPRHRGRGPEAPVPSGPVPEGPAR